MIALQGDRKRPYDSIIAAHPSRVDAVFIGGALYYGKTSNFDVSNQRNDLCETVDVCGQPKKVCVRDSAPGSGTSAPNWAILGFSEVIQHVTDAVQSKKPFDLPERLAYVFEPFPFSAATNPRHVKSLEMVLRQSKAPKMRTKMAKWTSWIIVRRLTIPRKPI